MNEMSNNIFFERGQMADKPNNYLWLGDCLELMKEIPDKSIDAIICDLPYGTTWAKWDNIISFDLLWEQYNRVIKSNAAIVLFSTQPFTTMLLQSNIKNYKYTWYWIKSNKGNYLNAKRQPLRQVEEINVFNKHNYYPIGLKDYDKERGRGTGAKTTMQNYSNEWKQEKTGYPSNVLEYKNDMTGLHSTQKPVELLKYLVETYTNENDWVLDNTCGSNTTGIVCYDLNRNYIGIEKDIDIYNVAKKRMKKYIITRK